MAGPVLVVTASVQCPHGGSVQLGALVHDSLRVGGVPVVAPGTHPVSGCPFVLNGRFSPCLQVLWAGDSVRVSSKGVQLIVKPESGICLGAGNVAQGNPVMLTAQNRVFAV